MVYVLDKNGQPLMPTTRHGKVRRILNSGRAKVVKRCPFTIQLTYEPESCKTQDVILGVDAGSKHIGLSAVANGKEVYAADVQLRNDIVDLLSTRRQNRRTRRNRLRYRKARFLNRVRSKNKGWLAPSVAQRIGSHLKVVTDVHKILPVTKVIVEVASFDIQKIKNPDIESTEYQQGEQLGFWNTREYVLFRDGHLCQCCKGKSKDKVLNVHHVESRKAGGNAPSNLITLCKTCHTGYHKGTVKLPKNIKRGASFKDAAFMGIMRWEIYNRLKVLYPDVRLTYGYITKNKRIEHGLSPKHELGEKSNTYDHFVDARCITGYPDAAPLDCAYFMRKVRCHNRQTHKAKISKGGVKRCNQAEYLVKGFRLFDKVRFCQEEGFIFGRRTSGYFDVRKLDGTKVSPCAGYKKLKFLETRKYILYERRRASSPCLKAGVSGTEG